MYLTVPVTWLPPTAKVMTEPTFAAIEDRFRTVTCITGVKWLLIWRLKSELRSEHSLSFATHFAVIFHSLPPSLHEPTPSANTVTDLGSTNAPGLREGLSNVLALACMLACLSILRARFPIRLHVA